MKSLEAFTRKLATNQIHFTISHKFKRLDVAVEQIKMFQSDWLLGRGTPNENQIVKVTEH